MAPITSHVDIARAPEEVFAYATDPATFSEWQDDVSSACFETAGPPGVGSRFTTTRRIGRSERAMCQEITLYEPPTRWAAGGVGGPLRADVTLTIEPVAGSTGSRLMVVMDFRASGIGKLIAPFVRRLAARRSPESYQHLKERLERPSS